MTIMAKDLYKSLGISQSKLNYIVGSWNDFLELIDENPKLVNRTRLIENYFMVKKKIGRRPNQQDMKISNSNSVSKYSLKRYISFFGGWSIFLKEIGEPVFQNTIASSEITKKQLIDNYYNVKKILKRKPSSKDLSIKNGNSKYGFSKYAVKFGSWNNFLTEIGEPIRELYIPKTKLIDELKAIKRKLKRPPIASEYNKLSNYNAVTLRKVLKVDKWEDVLNKVFGTKINRIYNIITCPICKKQTKKYYIPTRIPYCSKKCREIGNNVSKTCLFCKEEFKVNNANKTLRKAKFCSVPCYTRYRRGIENE